MPIQFVYLFLSALFAFTSCQKEDAVPTQQLSKQVAGIYSGTASINGSDISGDYVLQVTEIGPAQIQIMGDQIRPERFDLIKEETLGTISSLKENSHFLVYHPEEKLLTIARMGEGLDKIIFDGTKDN